MLARTHDTAELLFTLDDLSYLVRGGRIGSVRYHVAQALSIKPMITVSKSGSTAGTYITAGRIRRLEKAADAFVDKVIKDVGEGNKLRAMIFHGIEPTPDIAARIRERLQQHFDCVFLQTAYSTPVLGVHVGPLAVDIGYAGGDWEV
jgi:DegV family protein with EDD domain